MPFSDLREFIAKLEKGGEIQRIEEEVDWNLEVGAMIRRSNEKGLPMAFFQKIKGYPAGYRVFGEGLNNHRRMAIAMEMSPETHEKELIEQYIKRKKKEIKPVLVADGPCKENIHIGDKVDLLEFPIPMLHEGDGGRYIGTNHLTISRDLDSDWVNFGMYRHMLHDRNSIGLQAGPPTHVMRIREKWEAKNKPMEIAIAIGVDPVLTLCSASPIPYGVSEYNVAGGIRGEPVELVKCETVDLAVPATAEIVIEGELSIHELKDEGPFGEYTGYMGGHRKPRDVIHVRAVTHRNNPIFTTTCEGYPMTNNHGIMSISCAAEFLELLRESGLPVTGVSSFPATVQMLVVVAVKAGSVRADEVAHTIWASRIGNYTPYVVIVDEDVDPFNMGEVFHAIASKCHPYRGIVRLDHATGWALCPWMSRHEQEYRLGARVYFDCTWPPDWDPSEVPIKCTFDKMYPSEVKEKALAKWKKYNY